MSCFKSALTKGSKKQQLALEKKENLREMERFLDDVCLSDEEE